MRSQSQIQYARSHALFSSYSSFSIVVRIVMIGMVLLMAGLLLVGKSVTANATALIPEDAIRIRIIANSDSKFDQEIKRMVRDQVAKRIASWGAMPKTHEEARALIEAHLGDIRYIAAETLVENNVNYNAEAVLAKVPFPAKIFNGQSYAAGDYEALRVTLGEAKGSNWWCVLFPPLCLTAAAAPDADAQADKVSQLQAPQDSKPEAKFFLLEMFDKLFDFLKSLF
jgi:stage II sporulation protein R